MLWFWCNTFELLNCILLLAIFLTTISQNEFDLLTYRTMVLEDPLLPIHHRVIVQELFDLHLQILRFLQSCSNRIELSFHSSNVRRVGLNNVPNNIKISCHPASRPSASSSQLINLFRLHFNQRWH